MKIYVVHFLNCYKDGTSSVKIQNAYADEIKAYITAIIFNLFDENNHSRLNSEELKMVDMSLEDLNSNLRDLLKELNEPKTLSESLESLKFEDLKELYNWLFFFHCSRSVFGDSSIAEISECNLEDMI